MKQEDNLKRIKLIDKDITFENFIESLNNDETNYLEYDGPLPRGVVSGCPILQVHFKNVSQIEGILNADIVHAQPSSNFNKVEVIQTDDRYMGLQLVSN